MILCSRCKMENDDQSKFCRYCGNDLTVNVDAPASEDLRNLANSLNEQVVHTGKQPFNLNKALSDIPKKIWMGFKRIGSNIVKLLKKIGTKRIAIICCSLVIIVVGVILSLKYIVPFAPHYFKGRTALNDKDYTTAISEYEKAGGFLDAESKLNESQYLYAEELYDKTKYYEAAGYYNLVLGYEDVEEKIIQCGTNLLERENYKNAAEVFDMVDADEAAQMKSYASGMVDFKEKKYKAAKSNFNDADGYNDSEDMINACDLMIAEEYCKDGEFDQAKTIYENLPEGFTYNGISSTSRMELLNRSQGLINAMGEWTASDNYIESRNVYKSTGSWKNWYFGHDNVLSGQNFEVSCVLNDKGTFDIDGKVSFYKFDDYSTLSEYCEAEKTTTHFSIDNVTAIPSSYKIDSNTTLYYSGGVFSINYSKRDNYSAYFYNLYNSSVTYGNRS